MPENAVYVGRPTKWGNPFCVGSVYDNRPITCRSHAVSLFRDMLNSEVRGEMGFPSNDEIKRVLKGRDLACWCPLTEDCHADVLLALANE